MFSGSQELSHSRPACQRWAPRVSSLRLSNFQLGSALATPARSCNLDFSLSVNYEWGQKHRISKAAKDLGFLFSNEPSDANLSKKFDNVNVLAIGDESYMLATALDISPPWHDCHITSSI
jgi:hypothetical protein